MTRLIHLPGFGVVTALTVVAAIGEIARFEDAKHLVGYAGLGARIHDFGLTTRTGRITKAGRRDLRCALVEAAQVAAISHPHWKAELARLEPELGRNKAIVAIARKLLVAVWFVLAQGVADCHAQPQIFAHKLMRFAYKNHYYRHRGRSRSASSRWKSWERQATCSPKSARSILSPSPRMVMRQGSFGTSLRLKISLESLILC